MRPAVQHPEPAHLWIRYVPRSWPAPAGPWTDLARGRLGETDGEAKLPDLAGAPLDDLLYLPPVPLAAATARDELARAHLERGTPVLVQLAPGERTAAEGAVAPVVVVDLLPALLAHDLEALVRLPAGAGAIWPLLPALTDAPGLWETGCERLACAGAAWVQAVTPRLRPADRRRLAGADDAAFDALFHRDPPSERAFARAAHRHGLAPFLARPLPRPPVLRIENRRIAGLLALTAELWLRLGRPVEEGQALFRSARWIDDSSYDVAALAREGNLPVVEALDDLARALAEECVDRDEPALLAALLAEYVAPEETGAAGEAPVG